MKAPAGVLLCPPDHYDVVDVKNPHMEGKTGTVDRARARAQWEALADAFAAAGAEVHHLDPVEGCEDMVFCANPAFTGPGVCVLSTMRHESRQREVPAFRKWFTARGDDVIDPGIRFEGGGDALWHPGRPVIWCGAGPRSSPDIRPVLADIFSVEVLALELATEAFYHLDTCFAPLDDQTVLIYPPALDEAGVALIHEHFERVIDVSDEDARERFACNAAAFGRHVLIQAGCTRLNAELEALGFEVVELQTDEFLKSGGSVFCLKQFLFD